MVGTYWIALYENAENLIYLDSLGGEHIPKENKKLIQNRNIITNTSIWFNKVQILIDFMLKGKSVLLEYKNSS